MKGIVGLPPLQHCHVKLDTITTNVNFSFNGRRLVTSLILVITIVLLVTLLIFNLNCNIFTEASVNTTSNSVTLNSLANALPTSPHNTQTISPSHQKSNNLYLHNINNNINNNNNNNFQQKQQLQQSSISTWMNNDHSNDQASTSTSAPSSLSSPSTSTQQTLSQASSNIFNTITSNVSGETKTIKTKSSPIAVSESSADSNILTGFESKYNTTGEATITTVINISPTTISPIKQSQVTSTTFGISPFTSSSPSPSLSSTPSSTTMVTSNFNESNGTKTSTSIITSGNDTANTNTTSNDMAHQPCQSKAPQKNSLPANETNSKYFDIDYASKVFEESMLDKNAISLDHYIEGFKELMKFFHSLGSIFLFVTSDLETKIGLIENYRNIEKGGCNAAYLTIQSTVEYETKENLLRDSKRQSGARTILRLHRALEFLSMLMLNLSKLDQDSETAPAAREAYSNSLAKHHPWTIRTIASFAMRTLPQKKVLVESVLGKEHLGNDTATNEKMLILANVTENLFNVVDKYYDENNIKDLP